MTTHLGVGKPHSLDGDSAASGVKSGHVGISPRARRVVVEPLRAALRAAEEIDLALILSAALDDVLVLEAGATSDGAADTARVREIYDSRSQVLGALHVAVLCDGVKVYRNSSDSSVVHSADVARASGAGEGVRDGLSVTLANGKADAGEVVLLRAGIEAATDAPAEGVRLTLRYGARARDRGALDLGDLVVLVRVAITVDLVVVVGAGEAPALTLALLLPRLVEGHRLSAREKFLGSHVGLDIVVLQRAIVVVNFDDIALNGAAQGERSR